MNWVGGTRARRRGERLSRATRQQEYFTRLRSNQQARPTLQGITPGKSEYAGQPFTAHRSNRTGHQRTEKSTPEPLPRIAPPKSRKYGTGKEGRNLSVERPGEWFTRSSTPITKPLAPNQRRPSREGKTSFGGLESVVDMPINEAEDTGPSVIIICQEATITARSHNKSSPGATANLDWKAYILCPYQHLGSQHGTDLDGSD
ncbi:hypothetical protein TWF718_008935 [Orbilia javanica]|uniref:Uncharacterized protein n=1 Tax=Orbilia javanica TaxID=47235 RepID=A0AAN8RG08_9PEZI